MHQCWSLGSNEHGQQCNGNTDIVPRLSMIDSLPNNIYIKNIIHAAHGSTYILCKKQIIVFGSNEYQQLGIFNHIIKIIGLNWYPYTHIPEDIIILIVNFVDKSNPPKAQTNPIYIGKGDNIKLISSGIQSFHKFILTENNKLYGFGINSSNQIPIDDKQDDQTKTDCILNKNTEVCYFKKNNIELEQIVGGKDFSVFLDENGVLYDCGYPLKQNIKLIKEVATNDVITDISCGYSHCLALNENGRVYSWGNDNKYGQLGNGKDINDCSKPKLIQYFIENNIEIDKIDCGHSHNICLDISGKVYCFGNNDGFQCGIYNGSIHNERIYQPKLNEVVIKDLIIIDIKCGYYHNVICSKEKDYYLFGYNRYCQCLVYNDHEMFIKVATKYDSSQDFEHSKYQIIDIYPGYEETRIVTKLR